jgi:transposase InsO family protein
MAQEGAVPWKASRPVDSKAEFVLRLKKGERMTDLCEEYGINRQSGYEVLRRYEERGLEGLVPQSRAPKRIPHRTSAELVELVVAFRTEHPSWGPKKIKEVLEREKGVKLPSPSAVGNMIYSRGLAQPQRRRKKYAAKPTGLREVDAPNELWCVDYKGQFRLGDGSYCYPLTITDQHSRFILACEGMAAIDDEAAQEASIQTFRKYGVPAAIRSDNGVPFASQGLGGLTKLSVLWLRLGIEHERIKPGHPEQNGRHERMHRTLKRETTRPAGANLLQQQQRFDHFVVEFNERRPHEGLGQKRPTEVFRPSLRLMPEKLPSVSYPLHDDILTVYSTGHIQFCGRRYFLSHALAGQSVGLREDDDGRWTVSFTNVDLGRIDPVLREFVPMNPAPPAQG